MTEPIISPRALTDLDEIWYYIGQDDTTEADRVVDEVYAAIQRLAEMPGIGHTREDLSGKDYRFWPVYTYLIVYAVRGSHIEIVRILSGYRDVRAILG